MNEEELDEETLRMLDEHYAEVERRHNDPANWHPLNGEIRESIEEIILRDDDGNEAPGVWCEDEKAWLNADLADQPAYDPALKFTPTKYRVILRERPVRRF